MHHNFYENSILSVSSLMHFRTLKRLLARRNNWAFWGGGEKTHFQKKLFAQKDNSVFLKRINILFSQVNPSKLTFREGIFSMLSVSLVFYYLSKYLLWYLFTQLFFNLQMLHALLLTSYIEPTNCRCRSNNNVDKLDKQQHPILSYLHLEVRSWIL